VIVGAGAAGLATAIFARRSNPSRSVALLDGAKKPGAKILISGGSRCNVTNVSVSERDFWGGKSTIVRRVLRALPVADTIAFFERIGVPLHEEADGKLFPDTNRSRDVLDALLRETAAAGATLLPDHRVVDVAPAGDAFRVVTNHGDVMASTVVMATGGLSLPKSGSDGAGLEMAKRLGHTIVPTTPALTPLVLDASDVVHRSLSGVSLNAELALWIDGAVAIRLQGAMLWTHFGVSGPVALDASRHLLRARVEDRKTAITVNFRPGRLLDDVDAEWIRLGRMHSKASVLTMLATMVPASMAEALLAATAIDARTEMAHLSRVDRRRLTRALVEWPLPVTGSRGYGVAEATAGGVALTEIDPATMESRMCERLFLVGEMLDVDGRIGGFNFQWAWSSAFVAGRAIARGTVRA
jgi:predicted Rossmann fold flavoprotein